MRPKNLTTSAPLANEALGRKGNDNGCAILPRDETPLQPMTCELISHLAELLHIQDDTISRLRGEDLRGDHAPEPVGVAPMLAYAVNLAKHAVMGAQKIASAI